MARDDSLYPVTDAAGDIRGVVTVAGLRGLPIRARTGTRLGDVAVPLSQVLVADADDSLAQIRQRFAQDGDRRARDNDRCMLVFAGDRLVGILTPADVALAAQ